MQVFVPKLALSMVYCGIPTSTKDHHNSLTLVGLSLTVLSNTHLAQALSLPALAIERLSLLVLVFIMQVLQQRVQTRLVAAAHAVQVRHPLGAEVDEGQAPVHAEVHRDHHQVVREYVYLEC